MVILLAERSRLKYDYLKKMNLGEIQSTVVPNKIRKFFIPTIQRKSKKQISFIHVNPNHGIDFCLLGQ